MTLQFTLRNIPAWLAINRNGQARLRGRKSFQQKIILGPHRCHWTIGMTMDLSRSARMNRLAHLLEAPK